MRIAFYAPLNAPIDGTPSGDRRVGVLLTQALRIAGHDVDLVSTFRSFDGAGEPRRQEHLRDEGLKVAGHLAERWLAAGASARPQVWFTYHLYYKAPDWLGPLVSRALDIPYVVAEASHAAKRAAGPWSLGHHACEDAIRHAALLLCPTREDMPALAKVRESPERIVHVPPFLDASLLRASAGERTAHRARLAATQGIDAASPWLLAVGMMRPGDKLASYRALARTLALLKDLRWTLLIAGDGAARAQVAAAFAEHVPGRATFLGELGEGALAGVYAACDLMVWPAVNEAYGMALLEAQAAGLPVVAGNVRGVPEVVHHGETGLLVRVGDDAALADGVRALLTAPERRRAMGAAAAEFVRRNRSLEGAAQQLTRHLERWN
jgi:glycosyltransferase involved in cell wall biosynthesis